MSAPESKSTKELLKAAKLPERSVTVCLRGDLVADIAELERELEELIKREATDKRMTKSGSKQLAGRIESLREEMAEHLIRFRLRALKAQKRNPDDADEAPGWRELVRKYPPKRDDKSNLGVDLLAFMGEAIPLSVVSPDDMDAEDWQNFNENVPASEVTRLMNAVWELNTQGVDIPKSLIASVVNQRNSDD